MRLKDFVFVAILAAIFAPFFLFPSVFSFYDWFNREHGLIAAFVKFAILATMGESLGLRIREAVYNKPGFGLLPRAVVWGFLGISIKIAFVIFDSGTVQFLEFLGMKNGNEVMQGAVSLQKVLLTFSISFFLNIFYAPVLMTVHKITDTHIMMHGGGLGVLLKPIRWGNILQTMNWDVHWNFVLKKTIPLFWIPVQTINFLLPAESRILVAALLGFALGAILAFASLKK